jgi:SAM-dependent methyltransferase
MDKKQQTIDTYNATAAQMAARFDSLGTYSDIGEVIALSGRVDPVVLEIGCGNGRDAKEICKYTKNYTGIDISKNFIQLAKQNVPGATFLVADVEVFEFQKSIDIVFAFASLIHVPKGSLKKILERIHVALNPGGLVRVSLKYSDAYEEVTKTDEYGARTYYHYSLDDVAELTRQYTILKNEVSDLRGQKWIQFLLKKS